MTPAALQSYAHAEMAGSWLLISTGTEEQRQRAVVNLIVAVHNKAWLDGMNAGAAAERDGARQAHGAAIQPITT